MHPQARLVFPHQLFEQTPRDLPIWLCAPELFFEQFDLPPIRRAFHEESMAFFASQTGAQRVFGIQALAHQLKERGIVAAVAYELSDDWLERDLRRALSAYEIELLIEDSPGFVTDRATLARWFKGKKRFYHAAFYEMQRRRLNILIGPEGEAVGGRWSFDEDNRKKLPKEVVPPYCNHLPYATTWEQAREQLDHFLETRLHLFGPYEDAMSQHHTVLFHSVLSAPLNAGLITPATILERTLEFAEQNEVPLASLEGFVRQIIGWREFIRGVYLHQGGKQRTRNVFGFTNSLPAPFWGKGKADLAPLDIVLKRVLEGAYCHHIERLMILGTIMLLLEIDPDEVYRWFMTYFIDAYDWVMVPNVYGMSQYADGGMMTTKPYICASAYVKRMSDFPRGRWEEEWDALYWRFIHVHREVFARNPRSSMMVKTFDRFPEDKQQLILKQAEETAQRLGVTLRSRAGK